MPGYLKLLFWLLAGVASLCIAAVFVLSITNWNWARPWVSRQLTELTDRTVQIDGDLRIGWQRHAASEGWRGLIPWPVVHAQDVTVGNPDWATTGPTMVSVQSVRIMLDLTTLTQNVVRMAELDIQGGHLALERREVGVNNWTFGDDDKPEDASGWQVKVEHLTLDDASIRMLDATRDLDVELAVETSDAADGYHARWAVTGHYHDVDVKGEGQMGHVLALRDGAEPFPVQGNLHVGATVLKAEGTVRYSRDLAALDVRLELSGPTMADLYPILGIALPNTPPYQTAGRLKGDVDAEQSTWNYEDFTGTVGDSDLAGTLNYQRREPRPVLTGNLTSGLLRFEDLGPLIGVNGQENGMDDSSQPEDKVLPAEDADGQIWSVMDADVTFVGQRIESNADLPLDDVEAHVFLEEGILRLEPLNFGVAGGTLESTVALDGNVEPIQAELDVRGRGLRLDQLFPGVESMDAALGSVHADARIVSQGNSVSALMAHASGELGAVVSQGTVSRFLLEAAGLNVANMVFVKLFGDEQVMLQCLAAEFRIDDGLMETQTFVLETEDAVVTMDGSINLATEEMDLAVHPENKSLRIFTLRSPLYVAGTFKDPDVGVQPGPVAARAGAAVALGVVATPLAALLPLLNVGTDDETTCAGLTGGDANDEEGERLTGSVPGEQP